GVARGECISIVALVAEAFPHRERPVAVGVRLEADGAHRGAAGGGGVRLELLEIAVRVSPSAERGRVRDAVLRAPRDVALERGKAGERLLGRRLRVGVAGV